MLYQLAKKALFTLDAETAHGLTIKSLAAAPFAGGSFGRAGDDPVEVMGLRFRNRVGLAAGMDKNGECIDAWNAMGFGFCEVGTLTPKPQDGNPKPRVFRLPEHEAIINRLGFNNVGVERGLRNIRAAKSRPVVGINIGKNAVTPPEKAVDDYLTGLRAVYADADYITVNISSPNTKGLRDLQDGQARDALLAAIHDARAALADEHGLYRPVAVKLAPDLTDDALKSTADAIHSHGLDAVIATNTTIARDRVAGHPRADETGGLSGGPLTARSTEVVRVLADHLAGSLPIIGVGGITRPEHAAERIQAGASLVQIYTGLIYTGPSLVKASVNAMRRLTA